MYDLREYVDLTPGMIAFVYLAFGFIWITTSDVLVYRLVSSGEYISMVQTIKGGAFVVISGVIIWGLTKRRETKIQESRESQHEMSLRLQVLQRVFRHNIRNELNIVKGFIDLALEEEHTPELVEAGESAEKVIEISEKIKVVDRYPIGTEVQEAIDLCAVVHDQTSRLEHSHPEVSLETDLPDDGTIRADESVEVILRELLENAVQHFDAPTKELEIEVRGWIEGDRLVLRVRDNGPGIPSYELQALREGHETQLIHLSSVGLWIVQWLVERLNADIEFQTLQDGGTVVTVRFERAGPEATEEAEPASLSDGLEFFTR